MYAVRKHIRYCLGLLLVSSSLCGFSQKDTIDYAIKTWKVHSFLETDSCKLDTFLHGFQLYNPIQKVGIGHNFLGNVGQPYQNLILDDRRVCSFLFFQPYYDYLLLPENAQYYNTKQQYTDFRYVTNFSKKNNLQNVDLLHTQNILPNLNFGIQYRLLGALGEYQAQKTSDHFFRFFTSYQQKQYQVFLSYHYNKINGFLNGGITSDTLLDNPDYEISDPKLIPVNLEQSKTQLLGRNIHLKHSYSFGERDISRLDSSRYKQALMRWRVGHELDLNHHKRIYNNTGSTGFYQAFYIDTGAVRGNPVTDSIGNQNVKNTFFVQFLDDTLSPLLPSAILSYTSDFQRYQIYNHKEGESRHWLQFKVFNPIFNHWYWSLFTQYNLSFSDFMGDARLSYHWGKKHQQKLQFKVKTQHQTADYFYRYYRSHFYAWYNDFKQIDKQSVELNYHHKIWKFTAGIKQSYYNHYVYVGSYIGKAWKNDSTFVNEQIYGVPLQSDKAFGVLSIYAQHRLDWGLFHSQNALAFQQVSKECPIHLPQWQWYNSTYIQMRLFKRIMTMQIGVDFRINSAYFVDGFMPATGLFYTQNEYELATYPYLDAYVNVKVKRMRLFFKLEHINQGFTSNGYYTTWHHPMNPRTFRFGLSWRFYN